MPELPEVETVARSLYPHIHNCVFTRAVLLLPSTLHPLSLPLTSLCGMRIDKVGRRGKLLVLNLSPTSMAGKGRLPEYLVVHLRMTGRIFTRQANDEQGRHTRCLFDLNRQDGSSIRLFFDDTRTFGKIFAATGPLLAKWPFWHELGPEPLEMNADMLARRLKGGRPLKTALLDQKIIAGIGNIYADEALFQSGLLPMRKAGSLEDGEVEKLLAAIQDVLRRSISQCGSSIRDYRDAYGNVGAFQNSFMAYGRGGEQCKICGHIMQKCRIGGRATVYCPNCQK